MFDLVHTKPLVRNSWRSQISAMFLFPPLVLSIRRESIRWTKTIVLGFLVVGVCLELSYATWNIALEMTTFPHTALFAQLHPVFILFGTACAALAQCRHRALAMFPSPAEWCSVGVTVSGAIVTAISSNQHDQQRPSTIAGDLVAVSSSALYAVYFASVQHWFPNTSVFVVQGFATSIMMLCSFFILGIAPHQAHWSTTPPYGVFAWSYCDDVGALIAVGVLIAVGHLAITAAVQNLPLLVASVSMTLLPIVQTIFSQFLVGTSGLTVREIAGGIVTVAGVAFTVVAHDISFARKNRETEENSHRIAVDIGE